ncbi:hypothetical protein KM92DES2_11935 [uncultured Desulfovibrio sp.]|uniref:Uncharacterized protein n=1 Tax=uncultured Desulfovibrio sp. TaxID=167968 RepID=A0A212JYD0_9BACT|nr:hypothetical protein KM92DES2_11935 [uncultured Desulfovibrio sp.]
MGSPAWHDPLTFEMVVTQEWRKCEIDFFSQGS